MFENKTQLGKKNLFLISENGFQIYKSYSTVIAIFVPRKNLLLTNIQKYSVTTSKHQTIVNRLHLGAERQNVTEQEINRFLLENADSVM